MSTEKDDNRRVYLYELIALHRRAYEDAIKPLLDELAHLEALRTPVRLVPAEVAQSLLLRNLPGSAK